MDYLTLRKSWTRATRVFASVLLCLCLAAPTQAAFRETRRIASFPNRAIAGYALEAKAGVLFTWGRDVTRWRLADGRPTIVAHGEFQEGGCLYDVDGDGRLDVIVNQMDPAPALVWFHAPDWRRHVIDTGVDSLDIMGTELFGRRGVLVMHKRGNLRFYQPSTRPEQPWALREIYSFYTPSDEGGLAMADVDGDGLPDILCGNDWIQSPTAFDLPWHIFAIDLWNEVKNSALLRVAWTRLTGSGTPNRIAVQRAMPHARLAWFERPPDPKLPWPAHKLGEDLDLTNPASLAVFDADGDGRPDIVVAEGAGQGRLIEFRNEGGGRFEPKAIGRFEGIVAAVQAPARSGILLIMQTRLSIWARDPGQ